MKDDKYSKILPYNIIYKINEHIGYLRWAQESADVLETEMHNNRNVAAEYMTNIYFLKFLNFRNLYL